MGSDDKIDTKWVVVQLMILIGINRKHLVGHNTQSQILSGY